MKQYQRYLAKQTVTLSSRIAGGGEGQIYSILKPHGLVAKIYNDPPTDPIKLVEHKADSDAAFQKLQYMLQHPVPGNSLTWVVDILFEQGQFKGYLMRKLSSTSLKSVEVYTPKERKRNRPNWHYGFLVRSALSFVEAVHLVHQKGYIIGDINESNTCVSDNAEVTIIDTDSLQVRIGTKTFRCNVGRDEYTAPELLKLKKKYREYDRKIEHDLYGLAVLVFQFLMNGAHPFSGPGSKEEQQRRTMMGDFLYGNKRSKQYASFLVLHSEVRDLFERCFVEGATNPRKRPTTREWITALSEFEKALICCSANPGHFYGNHLPKCPYCRKKKVAVASASPKSVQQPAVATPFTPKPPVPISRRIQFQNKASTAPKPVAASKRTSSLFVIGIQVGVIAGVLLLGAVLIAPKVIGAISEIVLKSLISSHSANKVIQQPNHYSFTAPSLGENTTVALFVLETLHNNDSFTYTCYAEAGDTFNFSRFLRAKDWSKQVTVEVTDSSGRSLGLKTYTPNYSFTFPNDGKYNFVLRLAPGISSLGLGGITVSSNNCS